MQPRGYITEDYIIAGCRFILSGLFWHKIDYYYRVQHCNQIHHFHVSPFYFCLWEIAPVTLCFMGESTGASAVTCLNNYKSFTGRSLQSVVFWNRGAVATQQSNLGTEPPQRNQTEKEGKRNGRQWQTTRDARAYLRVMCFGLGWHREVSSNPPMKEEKQWNKRC